MKVSVPLFFLLAAPGAIAAQYECLRGGKLYDIEASSAEEAKHVLQNSQSGRTIHSCRPKTRNNPDIFLRDSTFASNIHLKPYIPADIIGSFEKSYRCDAQGGYESNDENDVGTCSEFTSQSDGRVFKTRVPLGIRDGGIGGTIRSPRPDSSRKITAVWVREGAQWERWVEFEQLGASLQTTYISPKVLQRQTGK